MEDISDVTNRLAQMSLSEEQLRSHNLANAEVNSGGSVATDCASVTTASSHVGVSERLARSNSNMMWHGGRGSLASAASSDSSLNSPSNSIATTSSANSHTISHDRISFISSPTSYSSSTSPSNAASRSSSSRFGQFSRETRSRLPNSPSESPSHFHRQRHHDRQLQGLPSDSHNGRSFGWRDRGRGRGPRGQGRGRGRGQNYQSLRGSSVNNEVGRDHGKWLRVSAENPAKNDNLERGFRAECYGEDDRRGSPMLVFAARFDHMQFEQRQQQQDTSWAPGEREVMLEELRGNELWIHAMKMFVNKYGQGNTQAKCVKQVLGDWRGKKGHFCVHLCFEQKQFANALKAKWRDEQRFLKMAYEEKRANQRLVAGAEIEAALMSRVRGDLEEIEQVNQMMQDVSGRVSISSDLQQQLAQDGIKWHPAMSAIYIETKSILASDPNDASEALQQVVTDKLKLERYFREFTSLIRAQMDHTLSFRHDHGMDANEAIYDGVKILQQHLARGGEAERTGVLDDEWDRVEPDVLNSIHASSAECGTLRYFPVLSDLERPDTYEEKKQESDAQKAINGGESMAAMMLVLHPKFYHLLYPFEKQQWLEKFQQYSQQFGQHARLAWVEHASQSLQGRSRVRELFLNLYDANTDELNAHNPERTSKVVAIIHGTARPATLVFDNETVQNANNVQCGMGSVSFGTDEYWNGLFVQYDNERLKAFVPLSTRGFGYLASSQRVEENWMPDANRSKLFVAKPGHHIVGINYNNAGIITGIAEAAYPSDSAERKRARSMAALVRNDKLKKFDYLVTRRGLHLNCQNLWLVAIDQVITGNRIFFQYSNRRGRWRETEIA